MSTAAAMLTDRRPRRVLPGRRARPTGQPSAEHRQVIAIPRELLERRLARLIDTLGLDSDTLTISIPEAGRLLDLSENTAYAAARRGEIPYRKFGKKKRVFVDALLALAATSDSPSKGVSS